jgi:hypothetical protein
LCAVVSQEHWVPPLPALDLRRERKMRKRKRKSLYAHNIIEKKKKVSSTRHRRSEQGNQFENKSKVEEGEEGCGLGFRV